MADINGKLDKLDGRIDNIDITLAKQQVILEEHQRRSKANEEAVDILKGEIRERHDLLMSQLNPLARLADRLIFLVQLFGVIGGGAAFVLAALQIVQMMKHG